MNIGFIGLGKLGLPIALAIESKGHHVYGFDKSEDVLLNIRLRRPTYEETGLPSLLATTDITLCSPVEIVSKCDLIFVAVQTPHSPLYDGTVPLPPDRCDFDYTYLEHAIRTLAVCATTTNRSVSVAVISTVLPGTMRKRIRPQLLDDRLRLLYNPFFIAMGTAINDFLDPEFVLIGQDDPPTPLLSEFYATIHHRPIVNVTVENAELIKVLYNTFISTKLAFANVVHEICTKTPNTNCDTVIDALSKADRRLISPAYLRGGMGDGGNCHPRDNIALSWLARTLPLSYDFFGSIMEARQAHTSWLSTLIRQHADAASLPVCLLGRAFKANTNIDGGSPAVLLTHYLKPDLVIDPHCGLFCPPNLAPHVFFIATCHNCWHDFTFSPSSIVLDPWRKYQQAALTSQVRYIPIGLCPSLAS